MTKAASDDGTVPQRPLETSLRPEIQGDEEDSVQRVVCGNDAVVVQA